jgi:hypothetical protein
MQSQNNNTAWEKFLDPQTMQDRLISSSLFIAAFEGLKSSIVDRVKQFYQIGFGIGGDTLDPKYKSEVLSRNSSPLFASLNWLVEHDAITESDIELYNEVKACRNKLSHNLLQMIEEDDLPDISKHFESLFYLLKKIEVWWILSVEIPCNPDFDGDVEIDEEGILPGPVWMMKLMMDVATGNSDYLTELRSRNCL